MSYHQDGLLDICIGVLILGFFLVSSLVQFFGFDVRIIQLIPPIILAAIIMPIMFIGKIKITLPRIGYLNLGKRHRIKITVVGIVVWVCMLFSGIAFLLLLRILLQYGLLIIGIGSFTVFIIFGYVLTHKRLYGYGLMTLIAFAVDYILGIPITYILFALGTTILLIGFTLLISFIRKYPPQGETPIAE
jgi:hypothetical protein